jgi:hypothetical protein
MGKELAVIEQTGMSISHMGDVFVKSGFFADTRDQAQAVVKIMAGQELGISPIASMTGVYIVKGKPSMGANLIAACVKRSGKYNYRVTEHTDKMCNIKFFEVVDGKSVEVGNSVFTIEDAKRAGTQNLDKFPRNMLFARAMSNGAKWYCADIFAGGVYTPEELGATVRYNEGGEIDKVIVDAEFKETFPDLKDKTESELLKKIGVTPDDNAPVIKTTSEKMSYELACTAKTHDGIPYSELPLDQLTVRFNELDKDLKKPDLPNRDEVKFKRDAAEVLIHIRVAKANKAQKADGQIPLV